MSFNRKNMVITILSSIIILAVTLISFFNKPIRLEVDKDNIKIAGIYGLDLKMKDIKEVTLKESLPQKINKSSMKKSGDISVGNFKPNEDEETKVFTYNNKGPFIYITTKNKREKYVIINYKDRKRTEDLYNIILSSLKNN